MNSDDDSQNYALAVVAGVVALVIALVIGVAAWSTSETAAPTAAAPAAGEVTVVVERIYFELSSAALPAEANEVLNRIAEAARGAPGQHVLISGFHDASGNAANNAELAKQRALAVRHGLEANGVPPEVLILDKPAVTTGGADEREARRVELRLQ